jgi:hypothetical protein
MFDSKKMPPLPRGLPAPMRLRAKAILEQNPHLWSVDQLDPVIRLAKLQVRFDEIERQIEQDGALFEHPRRGPIPHPLLGPMNATANTIGNLQRGLSIMFVTRGNNVKKRESQAPAPEVLRGSGKGSPKFRIA